MNRPTLIILVGIPGAGKTAYANEYIQNHSNTICLSSDVIRKEIWGDESVQGNPAEIFNLMKDRAVEALNDGNDVIYDATNMTRKDRSGIINSCPKFAKIECRIIWTPIEDCIERDASRERSVGKEVIDMMLKRFQMPYYDEGIDEIKIVYPENFNQDKYIDYIAETMNISHDNPHHTLYVYEHCIKASKYVKEHNFSSELYLAAIAHDCGKPYVKSFINSKGETTDTAHFYQHQCVGSWIACGIYSNVDILWLISSHMEPFNNSKYYNHLPHYLKEQLDQLHEADLAAH